MTEKRFTMIYFETDGNLIFDENKHDGEWYDSTECLQDNEIVELLNMLHEENHVLKVSNGEMEDYLARIEEENEQLKSRINELEEKVYHNLAWFLMYKGYFGIDLGEAIWNNADIQNHEQERELLNEYISIAKKRYRI